MNRWSTLHSPAWSSLITCVALLGIASCGDDSSSGADAAQSDVGTPDDARVTPPRDAGPRMDAGIRDAGDMSVRDGAADTSATDADIADASDDDASTIDAEPTLDATISDAGADDLDAPFDAARYRGDASRAPCPVGSECEAGEHEPVSGCPAGESSERICRDDCVWGEPTVCAPACTRPPMPSRTGADPVCIPSGPFILGGEQPEDVTRSHPSSLPVREITLSEFYVDRYPITIDRYLQCVQAAACPEPTDFWRYWIVERFRHPAQYAYFVDNAANAASFCEWDGGALPSEFQWEKAARGPAPRATRHAWGDADGADCEHHRGLVDCAFPAFSVYDLPGATSPYGVRLAGTLLEATRSTVRDYDLLADVDPDYVRGPPLVTRGYRWGSDEPSPASVTIRNAPTVAGMRRSGVLDGFRCVY